MTRNPLDDLSDDELEAERKRRRQARRAGSSSEALVLRGPKVDAYLDRLFGTADEPDADEPDDDEPDDDEPGGRKRGFFQP